jgi:hypothetical protein
VGCPLVPPADRVCAVYGQGASPVTCDLASYTERIACVLLLQVVLRDVDTVFFGAVIMSDDSDSNVPLTQTQTQRGRGRRKGSQNRQTKVQCPDCSWYIDEGNLVAIQAPTLVGETKARSNLINTKVLLHWL